MTRARHKDYQPAHPHFLTCTIVGQTLLFTRPDTAQRVLDSLRRRQESGRMAIYGYVVLEDHVHLIASAKGLLEEIDDFESSTAAEILELLETQNVRSLLRQLKRRAPASNAGGARRVWQERADPEVVQDQEMMRQKLEHIHADPVRRGYVSDPTLWRYSSARNYAGQPGLLPVTTDW